MSPNEQKFLETRRKTHPITDYHDFLGVDSTKEKCEFFNAGEYYINAAECGKCGWYVRSRNKHDMVSCKCGALAVDGGSHYLKRSGDLDGYTERSVLFKWAELEYLEKNGGLSGIVKVAENLLKKDAEAKASKKLKKG